MGVGLKGALAVSVLAVAIYQYFNPHLVCDVTRFANGLRLKLWPKALQPEGTEEDALTLKPDPKCIPSQETLFSPESLRAFDGRPDSDGLYLAYLGIVYDVSKGGKHYGPGGGYAFFAGRDGTRAFITGEFNEAGLTDDIHGLEVASFGGIREWALFYDKDYVRVGRVVGSYYDASGCPTQRVAYLQEMYAKFDDKEKEDDEEKTLFPGCNSQWSGETNETRVWCSKLSGGVDRSWVGVPRELFLPQTQTYRCACIRTSGPSSVPSIVYDEQDQDMDQASEIPTSRSNKNNGDLDNPRLREYPGCDPQSFECILTQ